MKLSYWLLGRGFRVLIPIPQSPVFNQSPDLLLLERQNQVLANQVEGDIGLTSDVGATIHFIQKGINNPVEDV